MSTTTAMPAWLIDKLVADGTLDPSTRLTNRARHRRCRTCGLYTLAGLDDIAGIPTYVDPIPTTTAGEAFALLVGRPTYSLDHGELYQRSHWNITGRPADTHPVYATHQCNSPPLPANPRYLPKPRPNHDTDPPF